MVTLGGFVTNAAYCLWQQCAQPHVRRLLLGNGGRCMPTTCSSARWPGRCGTRSSSGCGIGQDLLRSQASVDGWHSPGASSWRSTSPFSQSCGASCSGSGAGRRERPCGVLLVTGLADPDLLDSYIRNWFNRENDEIHTRKPPGARPPRSGQVAEVAGYLWQKRGWAERNGGNITVNVTEHVDDVIRCDGAGQRALSRSAPPLPRLKGVLFLLQGYRTAACATWRRRPMENGSVIRMARRLCVVRDHRRQGGETHFGAGFASVDARPA